MKEFEFISEEHTNHEALFEKILSGQIELANELRSALIRHIRMEEEHLFKPALDNPETKETAKKAWKEHNLLMHLLQVLDEREPGSKEWIRLVKLLKHLHTLHIRYEEEHLIPKLETSFKASQKQDMTINFRKHRRDESPDDILYPENPGSHQI